LTILFYDLIAYDILNQTNTFKDNYTDKEKQLFERRLELRINAEDSKMKESFLAMYANPVVNRLKYQTIENHS
jgi:hypothetical protein